MRILITGGAGFIGSHLSEAYLRQGDEVYLIDNLSTGSLENIKRLQRLPEAQGHLFVTVDTILNYKRMSELVAVSDVVIHLAAAVGVRYILDHPVESILVNVRGTDIVLDLCNKFKKKVLITSSSEVYGKHNEAPLREEDDTVLGPSSRFRWSYAGSKLMDEFLALGYYAEHKLPVVIVRLFNTVGPFQTGEYGMVIPRLIKQALQNEPITVYGDGTQTRTFTHVNDVIFSIMRLFETPAALGEVVNIGGDEEISILHLAEKIREKVGSSSEIKLLPYEQVFPKNFEDMPRRVPSVEKLYKLIHFKPTKSLDVILDDVIAHQKGIRSVSDVLL
jgi:UDP-glucose 4-epimerase